jgi:putative sterol carrier protein
MQSTEEEVVLAIKKVLGKLSEEKNQRHFRKWNKTIAFSFKEFNKTWYTTLTKGLPGELEECEFDKTQKFDISMTTDSKTWLEVINKDASALKVFQEGKLKIKAKTIDLLKLRKAL